VEVLGFATLVEVSCALRAARHREADPGEQNDYSPSVHVFSSDAFD
jgi:hypothetical protein